MEQDLKIIEADDKTILKNGRKKYAEIVFNPNKDYKWVIFFHDGVALSGFETKELAIERANKMFEGWNRFIGTVRNIKTVL